MLGLRFYHQGIDFTVVTAKNVIVVPKLHYHSESTVINLILRSLLIIIFCHFFRTKQYPVLTLPIRQVGPPGLWQPDHIIVPVQSPKDLSGSPKSGTV